MLLIPNRTAQQEQPLHSEPSFGFDNFNDTLQELPGFRLDAGPDGSAFVAAQGAQVLSWQAGDSIERLYLSPATGGMTRDGRKAAFLYVFPSSPTAAPWSSTALPAIFHGASAILCRRP
jgi:hypothetical protein